MHVQQELHLGNRTAKLFLEFELWVPRKSGASGVIEVMSLDRMCEHDLTVCRSGACACESGSTPTGIYTP